MPASDFLRTTTPTTRGVGASRFLGGAKPDIQTPTGLRELAQTKGIELPEPKKKGGFLGGVGKAIDVLRTGEFAVGGLLSGEGVVQGIKQKISPSSVLFEGIEPESRLGKIGIGALKFGADVLLDPTTYLTLGTGAAIKVTTQAGVKVALSKTGKTMIKELAEEIAEKSGGRIAKGTAIEQAKRQVAELATKEAAKSTLERGGLGAIRQGLERVGITPTREAVEKVLKEGIEGFRAPTWLKFFGKEIVKGATLKKPFSALDDSLRKTPAGKELVRSE